MKELITDISLISDAPLAVVTVVALLVVWKALNLLDKDRQGPDR